MFKFLITAFIAAGLISGATNASASETLDDTTVFVTADRMQQRIDNGRAPRPQKYKSPRCNNNLANILYKAGFTGNSHRVAWAIAMRESKGQSLDESSRYFTGALGIFQIQTSAHRNKSWWSRSNMLNPQTQANIVYNHMTNKGKVWVAWGHNPDGSLNTTHYRGWSSWQHQNWIVRPFQKYYAAYPCK